MTNNSWRFALLALAIPLSSGEYADVLRSDPAVVQSFETGFFCLGDPAAREAAPGTTLGSIEISDQPIGFVHPGDTVPSIRSVGFGAVVTLIQFTAWETVKIISNSIDDTEAPTEHWTTDVRPDGRFWFSHLGKRSEQFPPGRWQFAVVRNSRVIFSYVFHIRRKGSVPDLAALCGAPMA
jgi:hypothetical protein